MGKQVKQESVKNIFSAFDIARKHFIANANDRRLTTEETTKLIFKSFKKGYKKYKQLQLRGIHSFSWECPYGRKNIKSFYDVRPKQNGQIEKIFSNYSDTADVKSGDCGFTKQKCRYFCCEKCFKERIEVSQQEQEQD